MVNGSLGVEEGVAFHFAERGGGGQVDGGWVHLSEWHTWRAFGGSCEDGAWHRGRRRGGGAHRIDGDLADVIDMGHGVLKLRHAPVCCCFPLSAAAAALAPVRSVQPLGPHSRPGGGSSPLLQLEVAADAGIRRPGALTKLGGLALQSRQREARGGRSMPGTEHYGAATKS